MIPVGVFSKELLFITTHLSLSLLTSGIKDPVKLN